MKTKQLYINGEWIDSTGNDIADVLNPATEEVIAKVPVGTNEDVDNAVAAAKAAFPAWNATPIEERIALMEKFDEAINARKEEIADTIVAELGAGKTFALSGQVGLPLSEIRATIDAVKGYDFKYNIENAEIIEEG